MYYGIQTVAMTSIHTESKRSERPWQPAYAELHPATTPPHWSLAHAPLTASASILAFILPLEVIQSSGKLSSSPCSTRSSPRSIHILLRKRNNSTMSRDMRRGSLCFCLVVVVGLAASGEAAGSRSSFVVEVPVGSRRRFASSA